ncbi:MAG: hypothetical protein JWQ27_3107 [Ferruginibacter sp.]|nr:hypothetical protein [Ferruginibacter sp.]
MKLWTGVEKDDTKIIAYHDAILYLGNPKTDELEKIMADIQANAALKNMIGIPLRYIKEIHLEDDKQTIEIQFGADSTETIKLKDGFKRMKIFEYLKSIIPHHTFLVDQYSKIRSGKKPLIAMGVVLAIFLWTLYISNGFDQGLEYEVVGNQRSLATIVLGIASLGAKKVILIFGSLFIIAAISFFMKTRVIRVVQKIIINR